MEKVPHLDIFTQKHLRKSSSLTKLNQEANYRPSSSFQGQFSGSNFTQNYYGQALKLLNSDSKLSHNMNLIDQKYETSWKKSNIKKMTKPQLQQQTFTQSNCIQNNNHQNLQHQQQIHMNQTQKIVNFQPPQNMNRNMENIQPMNGTFPPNNIQFIPHNMPIHIVPQQHPFPNQMIQNNMRVIPQQMPINRNSPPQLPMQRVNSIQNFNVQNYSQPDKILSSSNIPPTCNNQQQNKRRKDDKVEVYTFVEKGSQNMKSSLKKLHNPFLFDATYLLEIKQSENKLPDIIQAADTKQYNDEMDKKKELLDELIQIKENNIIEGQNFLNQLDCLIQQFQPKQFAKTAGFEDSQFRDSQFRSSRRSLFSKMQ